MTGRRRKYFTVEEAEALIPELTRILSAVMAARREAAEGQALLDEARQQVAVMGGMRVDIEALGERRAAVDRLLAQVNEGLQQIVGLGGEPKDLEMGLVDFPFLLKGRVVYLCWKYGEDRIRFWHGLEEGYRGRKPLAETT